MDTKAYKTTEHAGYYVAGRKLELTGDGDGNVRARVGQILHLTDAQAKYPLLNLEIVPAEAAGAPAAGEGAVTEQPGAGGGRPRKNAI